jgi:hypothetical protein
MTAGESHFFDYAVVILRSHKAVQRTESPGREQLEIAECALGKPDLRQ